MTMFEFSIKTECLRNKQVLIIWRCLPSPLMIAFHPVVQVEGEESVSLPVAYRRLTRWYWRETIHLFVYHVIEHTIEHNNNYFTLLWSDWCEREMFHCKFFEGIVPECLSVALLVWRRVSINYPTRRIDSFPDLLSSSTLGDNYFSTDYRLVLLRTCFHFLD